MADLSFVVDYKQLKAANAELERTGKVSKTSAKTFEASYSQVIRWQQRFATEQSKVSAKLEETYRKQNLANKSARESANAFKVAETSAKRLADEHERLKRKYQEGYAAMDLYTKELNDLAVARKAGIISTRQQTDAVARLNAQLASGSGVFQNAANNIQTVGKRANRTGVMMQQAGYQFGDFAVQVQSGANPMMAFGQQATQLIGTMSMLAKTTKWIGIFSAAGIIVPVMTAVAGAIMRSREAASDTAEVVETFEDRLKAARQAALGLGRTLEMLRGGFENITELTLNQQLTDARTNVILMRGELRKIADEAFATSIEQLEANNIIGRTSEEIRAQAESMRDVALASSNIAAEARQRLADAEAELASYEARAAITERLKRDESVVNQLHEVRQTLQREAREAAQAYYDLVTETTASQLEQVALLSSILKYGEDSLRVATLRAEQEGKALGLIGQALADYIAMELAIRDIELAIKDSNAAGTGLAATIQAIDFGNAIAGAQGLLGVLNQAWSVAAAMAGARVRNDGRDETEMATLASSYEQYGIGRQAFDLAAADIRYSPGRNGYVAPSTSGSGSTGGGGGSSNTQTDYLAALEEEAAFKRSLIGLSSEAAIQEERRRELIEKMTSQGEALTQVDEQRIETLISTEAATRQLIEAEREREAAFDQVAGHIGDAFMAMVDGSKSVEDAFKDMLRNILIDIYESQVIEPMTNNISSLLGGLVGGFGGGGNAISSLVKEANGGMWDKGIKMYANGGVVGSPTMFGHSGGLGVMGEAGPEAIMPLKRGANGKLGVQVEGGSQGNVVVNQSFNFAANGDDSVKRIIAQAAPSIANMTKKSIIDDRRRGGQMKTTFG